MRAAEYSPRRSERSERNPGYLSKETGKPALAGDRTCASLSVCRPLKRARNSSPNDTAGGATLHFVSLRLPGAILCRLLRRLALRSLNVRNSSLIPYLELHPQTRATLSNHQCAAARSNNC